MDHRNQLDGDKNKLHLTISKQNSQHDPESPQQRIPEINDIYDCIYGTVKSKLEFYEKQHGKSTSKPSTPTRSASYDYIPTIGLAKKHSENGYNSLNSESEVSNSTDDVAVDSFVEEKPATPSPPSNRKCTVESIPNPDLLSNCSLKCSKCESLDFSNDRQDLLTEMNANLKVELDCLKQEVKKEIEKNNELNFEIANIETALEMYYKEAKYQRSTISSIYANMKNYSTNKNEDRDRYTYRRIKAISDYVETLKIKLQHQDRIIKDNFLENPYATDMMMKYDSVRQQLDKQSGDNQELKEEIKTRKEEEIEIIKELNRQKFKIEEKSKEAENYYKNELAAKDIVIANLHDKHDREMKEVRDELDRKVEDLSKIKAVYEAKISNYKEEVALVYRKFKNASNQII